MLGWLVRATVGTVVLGAVGYTVVAVPIGRRTLFEHGVQIFHTQPAQELVEDLHTASSQAVDRVKASLAREGDTTETQENAAPHAARGDEREAALR